METNIIMTILSSEMIGLENSRDTALGLLKQRTVLAAETRPSISHSAFETAGLRRVNRFNYFRKHMSPQ
jgi:hypothetical protein